MMFCMTGTETGRNETASLPCNTRTECAFLRFVREATILGTRHGVFEGRDHSDLVRAVRAADVEMCTALSLGVVVSLLVKSEAETRNRTGRWHTAAYLHLRNLGREALVIPF